MIHSTIKTNPNPSLIYSNKSHNVITEPDYVKPLYYGIPKSPNVSALRCGGLIKVSAFEFGFDCGSGAQLQLPTRMCFELRGCEGFVATRILPLSAANRKKHPHQIRAKILRRRWPLALGRPLVAARALDDVVLPGSSRRS